MNLAEMTKRQRDQAFRQQSQDPAKGVVFSESSAGVGSVPTNNLTVHKSSDDHDGRYYTESEVDTLLTYYYEPVTNGDTTTPEIVFCSGDIVMVEVS